jgi:hypothetical protein
MSNHQYIYESWVNHIDNQAEKKAVILALLDCTPACELQSIVNKGATNLRNATIAYKTKFAIKNPVLTLQDFVQEEVDICRRLDI